MRVRLGCSKVWSGNRNVGLRSVGHVRTLASAVLAVAVAAFIAGPSACSPPAVTCSNDYCNEPGALHRLQFKMKNKGWQTQELNLCWDHLTVMRWAVLDAIPPGTIERLETMPPKTKLELHTIDAACAHTGCPRWGPFYMVRYKPRGETDLKTDHLPLCSGHAAESRATFLATDPAAVFEKATVH